MHRLIIASSRLHAFALAPSRHGAGRLARQADPAHRAVPRRRPARRRRATGRRPALAGARAAGRRRGEARRRRQHRDRARREERRRTATRGSPRARPRRSSRACGRQTLRYDPLRDFEGVALIGTSPFLFVVPASLPVNTLAEFVALREVAARRSSRTRGRRAARSCISPPSSSCTTPGIKMETITYQGQPSAIPDLITGRVQFMTLGPDPRRAADQGRQAQGAGDPRPAAASRICPTCPPSSSSASRNW